MELARGEWLDYALLVGMTPDEYWFAEPGLLYNYAEKYRLERRLREDELWLQGAYFKAALSSTIFMAGLADEKTARKMPEYPKRPSETAEMSSELTEKQIEAERTRAALYFDALMRVHNKK